VVEWACPGNGVGLSGKIFQERWGWGCAISAKDRGLAEAISLGSLGQSPPFLCTGVCACLGQCWHGEKEGKVKRHWNWSLLPEDSIIKNSDFSMCRGVGSHPQTIEFFVREGGSGVEQK